MRGVLRRPLCRGQLQPRTQDLYRRRRGNIARSKASRITKWCHRAADACTMPKASSIQAVFTCQVSKSSPRSSSEPTSDGKGKPNRSTVLPCALIEAHPKIGNANNHAYKQTWVNPAATRTTRDCEPITGSRGNLMRTTMRATHKPSTSNPTWVCASMSQKRAARPSATSRIQIIETPAHKANRVAQCSITMGHGRVVTDVGVWFFILKTNERCLLYLQCCRSCNGDIPKSLAHHLHSHPISMNCQ